MRRHIAPCANTKKATEAAAKRAAKDRREAEKTARYQKKEVESMLEAALKGNEGAEHFLRNRIKKSTPGLREALATLDKRKKSR